MLRTMPRVAVPLAFVFLSLPLLGQELVRDLHPAVDQSYPAAIGAPLSFAGQLWFGADDGTNGNEIWRTDGTTAGTVLAIDVEPNQGSNARSLQAFGSGFVFAGVQFVYATNGVAVTPIGPPLLASHPGLTVLPNVVVYPATDDFGTELWATDGTFAGAQRLTDLAPGSDSVGFGEFVAHAGLCWFVAEVGSSKRLFASDGSVGGTFEVAPAATYGRCETIAAAGPYVFFTNQLNQLWRTDGTAAGTVLLRSGFQIRPQPMRGVAGRLLFGGATAQHGHEPWTSDGSVAGTVLLRDVLPGPNGSLVATPFAEFAGRGVFTATDGVHGYEPWSTDLTAAGTVLLADLQPGPADSFAERYAEAAGRLWFRAYDAAGGEPWCSDGTSAGTFRVRDVNPTGASQPELFTALGNRVFFVADDGVLGREAWISDGTAVGTVLLRDIGKLTQGSLPSGLEAFGLRTLFTAFEPGVGRELYVTDGTMAGTTLLRDLTPGPAATFYSPGVLWRGAWWSLAAGGGSLRLVRTDGTPAGTTGFLVPGTFAPGAPVVLGDRLLFLTSTSVSTTLFASDGTAAGTTALASFVGGFTAPTSRLVRGGAFVYFAASTTNTGRELWRTDGTVAGTTLVVDQNVGPGDAAIENLTAIGDRLFWSGSATTQATPFPPALPFDLEPWTSDGTAAGTLRLADLAPGFASAAASAFTAFQGDVWFLAQTPTEVLLCRTDGTPAGTSVFLPLLGVSTELAVAGDRLFFVHEGEVWSTDGTLAGTQAATDLAPGLFGVAPRGLVALGRSHLLAFTAEIDGQPRHAYVTDGTPAGTRRLDPAVQGVVDSFMVRSGTDLFLSARDATVGNELFVVRLLPEAVAIADVLGEGCVGSAGVPQIVATNGPLLGSAFAIGLTGAAPAALAAAVFAPGLLPGGDLGTCGTPAVDGSVGIWLPLVTDPAGQASLTIAVPPAATFLGIEFATQWVVLDNAGGLLGLLSLSPALRWIVGQ